MAIGSGRRQRGGGLDAWPGYVDALSTLLMVIIFVLLVFVLAQGFLSVALSSRDRALDRLNRQVAELAEMLALERGLAEELRTSLGRTAEELRAAAAARDALLGQLRETREERDRLVGERDAARSERDGLTARLADLDLAARGNAERLRGLEAQLAEALARAELVGGDATQTMRRLTETSRGLTAEQAARRAAEERGAALDRQLTAEQAARRAAEERSASLDRQLTESRGAVETARRELAGLTRQYQETAAQLAEAQRQLAAMRQEIAALDRQVRTDRTTIEARLSEIARLSEQIRALTALREQLERQVQAALARAESEETRRRAAEGQAVEAGRLGDSARAQVALLTRQLEELRAQIGRLAAALDAAEAANRDKETQIANLGTRLNAALAARVEELQRYRSDFFGRLREVLGERPEIRVVGDRFVFQSEVLFPPASAELSERGQQQIREIARVLRDISARIPADVAWVLRVDGHADRIPIRSARFASNWELSAARAIAVAQLLINEGLPPNRVAAAAFGDNQPLDPGDSPEALARNRRIELRLTDR